MPHKRLGVNLRTKITTLRPANAPTIVAGILYTDPDYGIVLHSIRNMGLHEKSRKIQFDAGVIDEAERYGCVVVEVANRGVVYTATMQTLRTRGRYVRTHYGLQLALALKWWSTAGVELPAPEKKQTHEQLRMFAGVSR